MKNCLLLELDTPTYELEQPSLVKKLSIDSSQRPKSAYDFQESGEDKQIREIPT